MAIKTTKAAAIQAQENQSPTAISNSKSVAAVILGGGAGTRLYPLTKSRAKPAVPIGGAYRLIDVPMSNCLNSGISKMYILTQFNSVSLNRHLARTYNFGNGIMYGGNGFVEVLAATQTPGLGGKEWFQGTADAVRQYSWLFEDIKNKDVQDIVILSGDHLYRMVSSSASDEHRSLLSFQSDHVNEIFSRSNRRTTWRLWTATAKSMLTSLSDAFPWTMNAPQTLAS